MARALFLSEESISDLEEIWLYIARDSVRNADRFLERLHGKCEEIAELEGIGRERDELAPGLRSIPFKRYVIFFQRSPERVEIVRILHGGRDLQQQFD